MYTRVAGHVSSHTLALRLGLWSVGQSGMTSAREALRAEDLRR